MLNVAVVGVGGWGKNLARNYFQIPDCSLKYVCDLNRNRLEELQRQLPGTAITTRFDDLLTDRELQACVIATTASTHYALCAAALRAGKDVFVEKPFVLEVHEAEELVRIAEQEGRILMVGHLLEYHPVVGRLKGMIDAGELGDIYYLYNQRVNLGTVRDDENALWSFAPHDVSALLYLLGKEPTDVAARGQSYLRRGIEDDGENLMMSDFALQSIEQLFLRQSALIEEALHQRVVALGHLLDELRAVVVGLGFQIRRDVDRFVLA